MRFAVLFLCACAHPVAPLAPAVSIGWIGPAPQLAPIDPGHLAEALVDVPNQRVYVVGADDHLAALALDTGATIFETDLPAAPLAVLDGLVAVVADRRVELLERDTGHLRFRSEPFVLPSIDHVTLTTRSLAIDWNQVSGGGRACCGGGVRTFTAGTVHVDLATGHVSHTPASPAHATAPLPADLHVSVVDTAFSQQPHGVMLIARALVVARDGGRTWSHPIPPLRREPPLQAPGSASQ